LEKALDELEKGAGTQFDATIVECLLRMHKSGEFRLLASPRSEELQQTLTPVPAAAPVSLSPVREVALSNAA
jgi:hypothetical protein